MSMLFSIGEFDYQIINPRYEQSVVSLVANSFAKYEPMSLYLQLSSNMQKDVCKYMLDNYLGREVSVMCIHRPSKTLCGADIGHGYNPDGSFIPFIPSDSYSNREKSAVLEMYKFCDKMDEIFFSDFNIDRTLCLHQGSFAVDKK